MKKIILLIFILLLSVLFFLNFKKEESRQQKILNLPLEQKLQEAKKPSNILVAVGDIMLSRHVGEKIRAHGDTYSPFLKTAEILKSGDITFGNLESPFYDKGPPVREGMVFKAEPETINGLVYAGFDIVSLANNHFGDQGISGMKYTLSHLTNHKIEYIGAGENKIKASEAKIIERNGIRFAFLGYNDIKSTFTPSHYVATSTKPGVNLLDEEVLKTDIKKAKEMADVVVVSLHWGSEYHESPNDYQKYIGHLIIDTGASVVLGHHPHVIQPYEKYKNGYIFYSLGNFIFDQMWSEKTRKGLIAKIHFKDKEIEKVETIPVTIYEYFQPRVD